jgi:hypothetical protein
MAGWYVKMMVGGGFRFDEKLEIAIEVFFMIFSHGSWEGPPPGPPMP